MDADQPRQATKEKTSKRTIAGLGALGTAAAVVLVMLSDVFAWLVPTSCALTSLTRLVRTFGREPRRAATVDRRLARVATLAGLLVAGGSGSGLWLANYQAAVGAVVYFGCTFVWFFFLDVWARETGAAVNTGPLLGRFRDRFNYGLRAASDFLNLPRLATIFGVPGKPDVNGADIVAVIIALLLGAGVAGADEIVGDLIGRDAGRSPAGPTKGSAGGVSSESGGGAEVKDERLHAGGGHETAEGPPTEGPFTPDDCMHPQHEQFLKNVRNSVGEALFEAWENVGVKTIGCLEIPVERVGNVWLARLSGWGSQSGLVVSDKKARAAVIFHQLRGHVEALVEDRMLLYAGDRVAFPDGDYQFLFLTNDSCRLAIRHSFGDDSLYLVLPPAVTVLVVTLATDNDAFPTAISEEDRDGQRAFVVDYGTAGSHSPASSRIVLTRSGRAYVASAPYSRASIDSPCPDVRAFDTLAETLE